MTQIKDKNKIEGAYLLLRRFKNRLKVFDETMKAMHETKANLSDLEDLKIFIDPTRAQCVMNDMKILFHSTVGEFEKKLEAGQSQIDVKYERILEKQNKMVLAIEVRYTGTIKKRIDRIEAFTNDLAMEQARLTACAGMNIMSSMTARQATQVAA